MVAPELLIGPTGLESKLQEAIGGATGRLWVMMYVVTLESFVDAFIAAHQRGVDVRVLLDPDQADNAATYSALAAAGVGVRYAADSFEHAHTKTLLVDDAAIILSGNLSYTGMAEQRNYGVIVRDPADLGQLTALFDSDWNRQDPPDLSCSRLLVSPINGRERILQHVERAGDSLDLAVMYLTDSDLRDAVIARHDGGVPVRVLLADPDWISGNVETAGILQVRGIEVRVFTQIDLHAKLIVSDGAPLLGSHNMSVTSFTQNREVGVVLTEDERAAADARLRFEMDWQAGEVP